MRRGCKRKYISTEEGKQEGTEVGRKEEETRPNE